MLIGSPFAEAKQEVSTAPKKEAVNAFLLARIAQVQAKAGFLDAMKTSCQLAMDVSTFSIGGMTNTEITLRGLHRDRVLSQVGIAYALAGEVQTARKIVYTKMTESGFSTDERKQLLTEIAIAQAKAGNLEKALETLQEIGSRSELPPAAVVLVKAQLAAGNLPAAKQTASLLLAPGKALALALVAQAEGKRGQTAAAKQTIAQAKAALYLLPIRYVLVTLRDPRLSPVSTWTAIALAQVEIGDITGALQTVEVLTGSERVDALCSIARGQIAKDKTKANLPIASALETAQKMEFAYAERIKALDEIAVVQHLAGDAAGTQQSLRFAEQTLQEMEGDQDFIALSQLDIAATRAKTGDSTAAKEAIAKILTKKKRPTFFLQQAIITLVGIGEWNRARDMVFEVLASKDMKGTELVDYAARVMEADPLH